MDNIFHGYPARTQRVIFWALVFARKAQAREIETEHILQGLLKVDPNLFAIVAPENPDLLGQIERDLVSGVDNQVATMEVEDLLAPLPLSELAKVVVAGARQEKVRLGQRSIASQHLLLALVKSYKRPRGWSIRRKHYERTMAQQILLNHGITPESVESRIQEGIVTPTTIVLDDPLIKLNAQLTALAELLISKGIFSRSEFVAFLDQNEDPLMARTFLVPLLDALFQKGKLTSAEKGTIEELSPGHSQIGNVGASTKGPTST
jgi:ATP-dependent Clp protease ATP-binding subunit ClpA